jgi:hypothetical protein
MRRVTHGDTKGRRVAATRCATHRDTGERGDATVSRMVARVVPPGCRVGGGDGDTACRC